MIKLVKPSIRYKRSYISALNEPIQKSKYFEVLKENVKNFSRYLKKVRNAEKGITKGVPRSELWLVDSKEKEYIGMIQIRHNPSGRYPNIKSHIYYDIRPSKRKIGYGAKILRLGLEQAKKLGLKNIIITCAEGNISSRKIIERNGGILSKRIRTPEGIILKYVIRAR